MTPLPLFFARASLPNFNGTTIRTLDVTDCLSCSNTRTLSDIIWSCVVTLFACTWTAIHPNIPGVDEGKVAIISRRLFIMGMALIAPELIITWAAQQFFSARKTAKDFNHFPDAQPNNEHYNNAGSSSTTLHAEIPQLAYRNSPSPNAPQVAGPKIRGRLHAQTFQLAVTNVEQISQQNGQ